MKEVDEGWAVVEKDRVRRGAERVKEAKQGKRQEEGKGERKEEVKSFFISLYILRFILEIAGRIKNKIL